jgi:hypothetical protein
MFALEHRFDGGEQPYPIGPVRRMFRPGMLGPKPRRETDFPPSDGAGTEAGAPAGSLAPKPVPPSECKARADRPESINGGRPIYSLHHRIMRSIERPR